MKNAFCLFSYIVNIFFLDPKVTIKKIFAYFFWYQTALGLRQTGAAPQNSLMKTSILKSSKGTLLTPKCLEIFNFRFCRWTLEEKNYMKLSKKAVYFILVNYLSLNP